jgi:putative MATE family efflux protein
MTAAMLAPSPLLSAPILPTLIRLAIPNMLAMVASALVAIAETAYVGRLGTPALAGLALVFPLVMLMTMMSAGAMGGGVSSAVSRAIGAGQDARASELALHAFLIGMAGGLLSTLLLLGFGESLYVLLGGRGAALREALTYSNIVFLGALGIWLTNTLASVVRGGGNMKVPSITLLLASVAQVVLGGGLGLGLGPLPKLGMAGIAVGQVLATSGSALFLSWYLMSGRSRARLRFTGRTLQREMFRDILKVGAVSCLSPLQTVLSVLVLTRLAASFGTEALAGYGIGARLEFLLIPIAFGVGVACVPMVGMAVGAGQITRARHVAWTGGFIAATLVGLVGLIVALFPDAWAQAFTADAEVLASARSYFRWVGPCYPFFGLGLCLYFAAQGSGKIIWPVLAGTLRLLVVIFGGWWLVATNAPAWQLFALIALSLTVYGVGTAASIYCVSWQPKRSPGTI